MSAADDGPSSGGGGLGGTELGGIEFGGITDVPGVRVGHATRRGGGWLTGVTVVLPPQGSVGGVDVRGGGPGTHETDALDPRTLTQRVDAVVLTGGSAYGLIAAHGAQRWCEQAGRGFRVGPGAHQVVPIVPAAAIFDLGRGGDFAARPTEAMGHEAALAAAESAEGAPVARGGVGAGTGAVVGGRFAGGIGTASLTLGEGDASVVVGALAVVNALGLPYLQGDLSAPVWRAPSAGSDEVPRGLNTTLAVVVTTARLDPAEASRTATAAHDGLARALDPVHTLADGDTVFALATGAVELPGPADPPGDPADPAHRAARVRSLVDLQAAAAEAVRRAVLDGVRSAAAVTTPAGTFPRWSPYG